MKSRNPCLVSDVLNKKNCVDITVKFGFGNFKPDFTTVHQFLTGRNSITRN